MLLSKDFKDLLWLLEILISDVKLFFKLFMVFVCNFFFLRILLIFFVIFFKLFKDVVLNIEFDSFLIKERGIFCCF